MKTIHLLIFILLTVVLLLWNPFALDPVLNTRFLGTNIVLALAYFKLSRLYPTKVILIPKWFAYFLIVFCLYTAFTFTSVFRGSIFWTEALFDWFKILDLGALVLLFYIFLKLDNLLFLKIAQWVTALSLIAMAIGLTQCLLAMLENGFSLSITNQMVGLYAHKNIFAEVCFSFLGFQCYSFLHSKNSMRKLSGIAIISSLLFIIILLSRNVWIASTIATIVSLIFTLQQKQFRTKIVTPVALKVVFGITILTIGLLLLYQFSDTPLGKNQLHSFYSQRNTEHERALIWGSSFQMVKEHPFLGIGIGSWKVEIMKHQSLGIRGYSTFFQQPHNDYLWVLSEQGIIGFLLCGCLYLIIGLVLFKQLFAKTENAASYLIILFYMVGYMAISIFAFPRERIEHIVILAIYIAWLFSFLPVDAKIGKTVSVVNVSIFAFCFVVIGSLIGFKRVYAESNLVELINKKNEKNWNALLENYSNAQNSFYNYDGVATPICWYKGVAHFNQNNIVEAKSDFLESLSLNPFHPFTLSNLGACEEMQGNHTKAKEYLIKTLQYSPGFADAVLNLAAIQHTEGNTLQAVETFATIADTTSNPRFETFREVLINAKVDSLKKIYTDETTQILLESLKMKRGWQLLLMKKTQYYHISFDKAIKNDIVYIIENDFNNIENKETIISKLQVE